MSRPSTGNGNRSAARPTHIAMPNNNNNGNFTPTGSPLPTPTHGFGATSPASPRHSFLGFIRTRSRAATMSNTNPSSGQQAPSSPSLERYNPLAAPQSQSRGGSSREGSVGPHGRERESSGGVTRSISTPLSGGLSAAANAASMVNADSPSSANQPNIPTMAPVPDRTFRIRLVPSLETQRSLAFEPVVRELMPIIVPPGVIPQIAAQSVTTVGPMVNGRPPALLLKIGRFTDKSAVAQAQSAGTSELGGGAMTGGTLTANGASTSGTSSGAIAGGPGATIATTVAGGGGDLTSGKVAFKSKVVSRSHAEIWCEPGGKFYIRDTKSSSGTFLNHIRLSSPNTESRPTQINDGDMLQLGVDYQGGTEAMFRCVKMRVEVGREWQSGANEFNTNALNQLKALGGKSDAMSNTSSTPHKKAKVNVTDCCICLFSITICQALFIAPCSHVFHYKCIRPLLTQHHPGFNCPICRTYANLEEDVEKDEVASRRASIISRRPSNHSIRLPTSSQPDVAPASPARGPTGQPSTGIGLGVSGASMTVEDLLANASSEDSVEDDSAEMFGSSALTRQTTAVGPPPQLGTDGQHGQGMDMDLPPAVQEEEEPPSPSDEHGHRHRGSDPIPMANLALADEPTPNANGNGYGNGNDYLSEGATPMNEHFLSTVAGLGGLSNQGIDQRLALAEELSGSGSASASASVEGHSERSEEDHSGAIANGAGESGDRSRERERERDVEMMFT